MGEREIANSMLNILQLDTLSEEEKWAAARSEAPRRTKRSGIAAMPIS